MPLKPIICIDFDGVLNNYKGYDGDNLGTPKDGAKEFLEKLHLAGGRMRAGLDEEDGKITLEIYQKK